MGGTSSTGRGVLVQGIMFPNLGNVHSGWVEISLKRFRKEGRENTWKTLDLLFGTFHRDSFENIESHTNYTVFVTALEKLGKARDVESVRTEFKTVLKEALQCLLPEPVFKTMVRTKLD